MEYMQHDVTLQSLVSHESIFQSKDIMAKLWQSQSWPNELNLTKASVLE